MLTIGVEVCVFKQTAIWIGRIAGSFIKKDGTKWIVIEGKEDIFFVQAHEVRNIRDAYKVRG